MGGKWKNHNSQKQRNYAVRTRATDGEEFIIDGTCVDAVERLKGQAKQSPQEHHMNEKTLQHLNSLPNCHAHKVIGTVYARTGQPDIMCCYRGRLYCLEGKRRHPGIQKSVLSDVKPHQRAALMAWGRAGARVGVYTSPQEAEAILGLFVTLEEQGYPAHEYWVWCDPQGRPELHHVDTISMRD